MLGASKDRSSLLIRNARVFTSDDARPWAGAVAVEGERISWVGDDADAREHLGARNEVIDANDAAVFPGFVDAHNHVRLGSNPGAVQLSGATTLDDLHGRLAEFAEGLPEDAWIEGEGWNYGAVPGGAPTADMLPVEVTGPRPAFLFSYDVHTVWLNREAMTRLGVTSRVNELPWGRPELDSETREPTGWIHDFAVRGISEDGQRALAQHLPGFSPDATYARLLASLDMAARFGITTVVEPQNELDDLELFVRAREEGTLRSRLIAAIFCEPGTTAQRLDAIEDARRTYDDDRLRVSPIKLYIDDVIEPHTAAMLEPYANRPDVRGDTFWEPREFEAFLIELEWRGFQAFTHATGDRGIRARSSRPTSRTRSWAGVWFTVPKRSDVRAVSGSRGGLDLRHDHRDLVQVGRSIGLDRGFERKPHREDRPCRIRALEPHASAQPLGGLPADVQTHASSPYPPCE